MMPDPNAGSAVATGQTGAPPTEPVNAAAEGARPTYADRLAKYPTYADATATGKTYAEIEGPGADDD
jgi:hypothetical protein